MNRWSCALVLIPFLVGCGGSSDDNGANTGGGSSGGAAGAGTGGGSSGGSGGTSGAAGSGTGGTGGGVGGGESFSVDIGPIDVPSGYENTQCVVKRLHNPANFRVGLIENEISSSSHHMIVYRTNDTEEKLTPFDCSPFVETLDPTKGAPVMITQKSKDELKLPEGVAFTLNENQMIRLELHYINTTPGPVQVTASSKFTSIPESAFKDEADFLFIGNPDIKIPANSSWTLGPTFFPLPSEYDGVNFFAITGHEHHFGTNVKVSAVASESDPGSAVYDVPGWQWDEPETVKHDPPFQVPKGGGFSFTCDWKNTSNKQVSFGESANAEMCFFWAYYYPSKGAKVCFHSDQASFPINDCCPGGALCSFLGN
ncbi:MAG: hypothetical protein KC776_35935 [Myxococcales bacterium]|nr:hypothetical protein [Myxococcales bacterium]MCB9578537.1 hypothetical protein [Polyangiaceae bacterium]